MALRVEFRRRDGPPRHDGVPEARWRLEVLTRKDVMYCSYHSTRPAVVQCNSCGRRLCQSCDHRIRGFPTCQDCIVAGVELLKQQQNTSSTNHLKVGLPSPLVAGLLSLVLPGLGAAYNGHTAMAIAQFAVFASLFQLTATTGSFFFVWGIIGMWLFAPVDAYRTAKMIRAGADTPVGSDTLVQRMTNNPLAWGAVLAVTGLSFLLHMLFDITLPIRELLPFALVGFGGYMIYEYARRHGTATEIPRFEEHRPPPSVVSSPLP
ncbi:MAG: hypothetical protein ACRD63_09635, partial [Pyrinomonadaceae bacterium]